MIDREIRDRLVARDKKSVKLLKPFLRGENVKRWHVEPEGLFLINTPKGKVDIDDYPAIRDWLLPLKPDLEKSGSFCGNTVYFIPSDQSELVAVLNSKLAWAHLFGEAEALRGGKWRLRMFSDDVATLPIPNISKPDRTRLKKLSELCASSSARSFDIQDEVRRRIIDLAPPERAKLSRKLEDWWTLDFAAFRDEVKHVFRTEIPVKERGEWEKYLGKHAAEIRKLDTEIEKAEREIDAIVYRLFDLTKDEIRLLEESIAGQH